MHDDNRAYVRASAAGKAPFVAFCTVYECATAVKSLPPALFGKS